MNDCTELLNEWNESSGSFFAYQWQKIYDHTKKLHEIIYDALV